MKFITIIFLSFLCIQSLFAQVISYNQQFQIFENAEWHPDAAALNDGGYIVCGNGPWGDYRIYAQIFNADHSYRGEPFQINTNTSQQEFADIICLSDSTVLITWRSSDGIFGQLFTYTGLQIGTEFKLVPDDGSFHSLEPDFQIARLNTGGFVVCWQDMYPNEGYTGDIFAAIFDENFQKIGDSFIVNTYTEDTQEIPRLAVAKNGDFVISWISNNQDDIRMGVYYQIFDESGNKISSELRATPTTNTYTPRYNLCALADGGFVFIWPNSAAPPDIIVQRYDSSYRKYDETIKVKAETGIKGLAVFPLTNGRYLFTWECYRDIYGQYVKSDNSKYRNEFKINSISNSTGGFNDPKAIQLKNNELFFTWIQKNPTYYRIYGKHFLEKLIHPLLPYNLVHPQHDEILTSTIQTLQWEKPTNLQYNYSWDIDYKIFLDTIAGFENPQLFSEIYDTCQTIVNLEPGTEYYWKVLAKNLDGDSLWSTSTNSFSIIESLLPFSLLWPKYDETIAFLDPTLQWRHASGLDFNSPWKIEYQVYIDKNADFSNPDIISEIKDTTYSVDSLEPGSTYYWKVLAKDERNDSLWSSETNAFFVDWNAVTSLETSSVTPTNEFMLHLNYPNPFNPSTTIAFEVALSSHVLLKIFDLQGREVALLKDEDMPTGQYQVTFDAGNLASGVYFYSIQAGSYRETRKMLLLR